MELSEQEMIDVHADFVKCSDLALRMAQFYPEAQGVWVGTVSERLTVLFNLMIKDLSRVAP